MSDAVNRIEMEILVIDDDPNILESVGKFLRAQGHRVHLADRGEKGLEILKKNAIDITISDVHMPGMDGFEVLREARKVSPSTEVIMITAHRDLENAFRAMREGAFDFFTKPFKVQDINASLQRTVRFQKLHREKNQVQERLDQIGAEARESYGLSAIIGESQAICAVRELIMQVSQTEATTVLIQGETGTGKELVARAIHYESDRSGGPFVPVNCSAIPEALLESAFFGHEKGAFTDASEARKGHFEHANGGTLFLDEIGDMDLAMQAKLLRTLEDHMVCPVGSSTEIPVDVRVVSATNQNLVRAVSESTFREDLYHRLNVFNIQIPPLRQRPKDILPLAQHFLKRYAQEMRKSVQSFSVEAGALLERQPFSGNIRVLKNTIERAVILCKTDQIMPDDLQDLSQTMPTPATPTAQPEISISELDNNQPAALDMTQVDDLDLDALEREAIREAMRRCDGNKAHAAKLLGTSRTSLRRRMRNHGLDL